MGLLYGLICERGKRSNRGAVHGGKSVTEEESACAVMKFPLAPCGKPFVGGQSKLLIFNLCVYEFSPKAHCIEAKLYLLMYTKYVTHRGNFTAISAVDWKKVFMVQKVISICLN